MKKLFTVVNNCFFLPKKIYVTQDKYNEREQALMKVSLQQGMESTVEATSTALLQASLEPESTKLMGASIDSKISRLDEEAKRRLQSFEDKLEENTNKRLKRMEELLASLAANTPNLVANTPNLAANTPTRPEPTTRPQTELQLKPHGGPPRGAQQKKTRGMETHKNSTSGRTWTRGGQASGRGRGRGRTPTPQRAVTFDMSRNQSMDPPNHYSPPQQQTTTNQEIIVVDNEPDTSNDGWGRRRGTSNDMPPSSLNDGWKR
jgi:hypothetical protein